ncbi:MAG: hypothetical protein R2706_19580 [Acidimicrobiales bacterium]
MPQMSRTWVKPMNVATMAVAIATAMEAAEIATSLWLLDTYFGVSIVAE